MARWHVRRRSLFRPHHLAHRTDATVGELLDLERTVPERLAQLRASLINLFWVSSGGIRTI